MEASMEVIKQKLKYLTNASSELQWGTYAKILRDTKTMRQINNGRIGKAKNLRPQSAFYRKS